VFFVETKDTTSIRNLWSWYSYDIPIWTDSAMAQPRTPTKCRTPRIVRNSEYYSNTTDQQ